MVLFVHTFVSLSLWEKPTGPPTPLWEAWRSKISSLISKIADFLRKKTPIFRYSKDMQISLILALYFVVLKR